MPDTDVHGNSTAQERTTQDQLAIVALDLKRIDKGAVYGSVTLWFPAWKLRIYEVLWGHRSNGEEWVQLPSRSWTAEDGATCYTRLIGWGDDATERRFRKSALEAIHRLIEKAP